MCVNHLPFNSPERAGKQDRAAEYIGVGRTNETVVGDSRLEIQSAPLCPDRPD